MNRRWPAFAALACALAAGAAPGSATEQEVLPLAEVRPGQRGTGLSVFSGSVPEPFELEVLGVWRNVRPGASYILARLEGQGLERSGVIAGMSGSPVYLEGKLAGAVAFAWAFAQDPIAGITPIESMRELASSQRVAPAPGRTSWPWTMADLVSGRIDQTAWTEALTRLGEGVVPGARSGVQWVASGLGERSRELLRPVLGSVAPVGAAGGGGDPELPPGGAVAAVLVDGDLLLAAAGTVTDRIGDRVLAFGHPFLGLGSIRFPMASAEVLTVVASRSNSFKIANVSEIVGAFDFDQASGIHGRIGAQAPMIPMEIRIAGADERRVAVRVAEIPQLSPSLVAVGLLGALESNVDSAGSQGVDLEAEFHLAGGEVLRTRQSFDGPTSPTQAALHLFAYSGFLLQNPLAEVEIEKIEVEARRHLEPRTARLVGAHASRTKLEPGERLEVNLDLAAFRGDTFRRSIGLELPTDLPEGRYSLLVGDGVSADAARLAILRSEPVNLRQALDLLSSFHSRREVVVLGVFAGSGLAVAGEALPQLPASIRSQWQAAASGSAAPLKLALAQQETLELAVPVEGIVRIDLEIKRRTPLEGGGAPFAAAGKEEG